LAKRGLHRGDHLALIGTNSLAWVESYLAATALGAIVVPVNTRLTLDEMRWTIEASRATWVILKPTYGRRDLTPLVRGLSVRLLTINGDLDGVDHLVSHPTHISDTSEFSAAALPDDVAVILFTSGSTALPKGCMLSHQGIVRNACMHVARLGIAAEDRWFSPMPFFHAGGLVWGLTSVLVSGACLVSQEIFSAAHALDLIELERCTYHHGIDTMFIREMEHPAFRRERVASLQIANSTGGSAILRRIHDEMGIEGVVSKWGITEGYGNLTLSSPRDPLEKRLSTVGRGYPGLEYAIVDPVSGRSLPQGAIGEVRVRGCAMVGYYGNPDATATIVDKDGWIHTGDLGAFDDQGYLTFHGRIKEMLKVGGENVSALEVETSLLAHPSVQMAFVVSAPHTALGEVPIAFIVARTNDNVTSDELDSFCRTRLADFKRPRAYVFTTSDKLKFTGSGKVVKRDLERQARELVLTPREISR
jgi:acyl-CoA synthetase (AMP-forming)/AMP-acid ligase II